MALKTKFGSPKPTMTKEEEIKKRAEVAVLRFQEQVDQLNEMKAQFAEQFPEAAQAQEAILQQEDVVRELVKTAHAYVQEAKESIGPFSCVRKWSSAGYDDEAVTKLLLQLENSGDVIVDLMSKGVIEQVVLSKDATAFFAQNPEYGEVVATAWCDKKEKTAAVTDPKI